MKKLFIIFLLFFSSVNFAQDLDFAQKLNKIDSSDLKSVATEIISSFRGDFKPKASFEVQYGHIVLFYPAGLTEEQVNNDLKRKQHCELCHKLYFQSYYEGRNEALEIPGQIFYRFSEVKGKYLDLFPFWEKYFAPGSTPEKTVESPLYERTKFEYEFLGDIGSKYWIIRTVD